VNNLRINKLILESTSLPDVDRRRIIAAFHQKAYSPDQDEFTELIRQALRDLGYFKVQINKSDVLLTPDAKRKTLDVTARVEPGAQYRLGEISFHSVKVFSSNRLRNAFPIQTGHPFNTTKFSNGLDALRQLYATRGFVNMVFNPLPKIDESRHIIDLTLDIDEGKPFNFGRLYLVGVEPHAGAAKALMTSWIPLEGKRFNSLELQKWFDANRSTWHAGPQRWQAIDLTQRATPYIVNVTLKQPCW
jgi:outer membrane translocation and assembly module TamA